MWRTRAGSSNTTDQTLHRQDDHFKFRDGTSLSKCELHGTERVVNGAWTNELNLGIYVSMREEREEEEEKKKKQLPGSLMSHNIIS